jgi:uncharacterized protein (DUF2237 family)
MQGLHTLCIVATAEFLEFSRAMGNNTIFRLKTSDHRCLCVTAGRSLPGRQSSRRRPRSHHALEFIPLEDLQAHAAKD